MTRILGIDPGPEISAFVILEDDRIIMKGIVSTESLLWWMIECEYEYDHVAIEDVQHYGKNVGSDIFDTCKMIGDVRGIVRAIKLFRYQSLNHCVRLYKRPKIKGYVTGFSTAKKSDVRSALIEIYGKPKKGTMMEGFKDHLWDALAVAYYHQCGLKVGGWKD